MCPGQELVLCLNSYILKVQVKQINNEDEFQKSTEMIYICNNQPRVYSLLSYVWLQIHLDS